MSNAETISVIALFVSLCSFAATLFFNLRDRAHVITKSTYYPGYEGDSPKLAISIVNAGRRPIVLRMWAGSDGGSGWVGTKLRPQDGGMRLAEHEMHEVILSATDLIGETPDESMHFSSLWFEDTLGRRHFVANAEKNIARLKQANDFTS